MIELKNITKVYDNNTVGLSEIDLTVKKGEFVFLVGSSGSGKSSLLKMLMKEIEATEGQITVNSALLAEMKHQDVPFFRRNIGVIFQDFRLLPNRTVYENVAFAMQVVEASHREIRKKVPLVLSLVGLAHKAKAYPEQLSGGEQQRTAIARAIVNDPVLLLADEPTGNLDPKTTMEIMGLLNEINLRGTTVLMATHDQTIVNMMKKRVILMQHGKIIKDTYKGGYSIEG